MVQYSYPYTGKMPVNTARVYIKTTWKIIQSSSATSFDWSSVDKVLAALPAGINVALAVDAGKDTPSWVYAAPDAVPAIQGIQPLNDAPVTVPLFHHANFVKKWTAFVRAFGNHYNVDVPTLGAKIDLIKLTGLQATTDEYGRLDIGADGTSALLAAGFDADAVIKTNAAFFTAFQQAFPKKYLALMMQTAFGFIKDSRLSVTPDKWPVAVLMAGGYGPPLQRITQQQAVNIIGKSALVLQNNGLTGCIPDPTGQANGACTALQLQTQIGLRQYAEADKGFTAWQQGDSVTDGKTPHNQGPGTPAENFNQQMENALSTHPLYIEIYPPDLLASDATIKAKIASMAADLSR